MPPPWQHEYLHNRGATLELEIDAGLRVAVLKRHPRSLHWTFAAADLVEKVAAQGDDLAEVL